MIKTQEMFRQPRFRSGVQINRRSDSIALEYREQSCDLELDTAHVGATAQFLDELQAGGVSLATLRNRTYSGKTLQVDALIEEFDRLGLITETELPVADTPTTGSQLYRELVRTARKVKYSASSSEFYQLLREGRATKRQIIGYALEYYHVVRMAPGLIGPVLAIANTRKVQHLLQEFLRSELFHDRMLAASLSAVGIRQESLEYLQPLPGTFSLCASLGVFAKQHPLSFYGALFLFEESYPEFHEALAHGCETVGIGKDFYDPIIRHATVNEDFGHDNISRQLLQEISAVSSEEVKVTKKNIAILVEMFVSQERDIVSYYGDDSRPLLRVFN